MRGDAQRGFQIFIKGAERFRITEFQEDETMISAYSEALEDVLDADKETNQALLKSIKSLGHMKS